MIFKTFLRFQSSTSLIVRLEFGNETNFRRSFETFRQCQKWYVRKWFPHCAISFSPISLSVITTMNTKYKVLLSESKKLNGSGLLQKATANNITADKLIYEYAIQIVISLKPIGICLCAIC